MRWKARALGDLPRPTDNVFASVHGEPSLECVVLGNGSITGWGVASHQIGFVGALARALAHRFDRGVAVRGAIDPDLRVTTMRVAAEKLPWRGAQVGVLSFGPMEILDSASARAWQGEFAALVREIRERMPVGSALIVLGIPPLSALQFLDGIGGSILDGLITRYNEKAAAVCAELDGVLFVCLPDPGVPPAGQYRTPVHYLLWAEVVAAYVAVDPCAVEVAPPSEAERSRTVDELGNFDDAPGDDRFDRVVRLARSLFRTESAAFTVLQGSLQWDKSSAGLDRSPMPRDQSICEIAVAQAGPLVIGDAWDDARFDDNSYVHDGAGVRFYAGYPLRARDGNYIGALCVFDPEPRDSRDVDIASLRDLALMIEEALEEPRPDRRETTASPGVNPVPLAGRRR